MKWNMDTFLPGHTILPTGDMHLLFHPGAIPQMVERKTMMGNLVWESKKRCD